MSSSGKTKQKIIISPGATSLGYWKILRSSSCFRVPFVREHVNATFQKKENNGGSSVRLMQRWLVHC